MIPIHGDTKIAAIIKANKDSIEAIAGVAKVFEKLRNPFLRKMLAPRTTLNEAARMAGCGVQEIARKLEPLGFIFINGQEAEQNKKAVREIPEFVRLLTPEEEQVLDVRADLQGGNDPLKKIMQAVNGLPQGQVLRIINTFEPAPLISLLAKKGFESYVMHLSGSEVHTFFKLRATDKKEGVPAIDEQIEMVTEAAFSDQLAAFGSRLKKVDVREMEMPMPMVTILESLSALPREHALLVSHKRVPIFLFSELRERNFQYIMNKAAENEVQLLIYRQTGRNQSPHK